MSELAKLKKNVTDAEDAFNATDAQDVAGIVDAADAWFLAKYHLSNYLYGYGLAT
jgi:hypothetical protein